MTKTEQQLGKTLWAIAEHLHYQYRLYARMAAGVLCRDVTAQWCNHENI